MIGRFLEKHIDRVFNIGTKVIMTICAIALVILTIRNLLF